MHDYCCKPFVPEPSSAIAFLCARAHPPPRPEEHITMWLDKPGCRAAGYVMLSRVASNGDYLIAGPVCRASFTPAM